MGLNVGQIFAYGEVAEALELYKTKGGQTSGDPAERRSAGLHPRADPLARGSQGDRPILLAFCLHFVCKGGACPRSFVVGAD